MFAICNHLSARTKIAFKKSLRFGTHFVFSNIPCYSAKLLRDINYKLMFRD